MHNSSDVDQIFGNVKNIFDCNRCAICDTANGSRMRYPCGHTACDECVNVAEECLICLTPPLTSTPNKPVRDDVLIKRVQNAATLLKTCQKPLNIDVLRKQRISDQLKAEKEVFPDCIQAPVKYCNKRKSLNTSYEKKSKKLSPFPGEQVSFNDMKMEKSSNFVHAWLNKIEKPVTRKPLGDINVEKTVTRKPLGDLNVNQRMRKSTNQPINRTQFKEDRVKENIPNELKTKRKRSQQSTVKSQTCLEKYLKSANEFESNKRIRNDLYTLQNHYEKNNVYKNDESGIVMDDGPIIIDDSQSQIVDKDKEAWLTVLEAENNLQDDSVSISRLDSIDNVNCTNRCETTLLRTNDINDERNHIKVPFYKKSYMVETCPLCMSDYNDIFIIKKERKSYKNAAQFNDNNVSITIDSNTFVTTIQVRNTEQNKQSVLVQTDIHLTDELYNHIVKEDLNLVKGNKLKTNGETMQFSISPDNSNKGNELGQNVFTDQEKITDSHKDNLNIALEEIENVYCASHKLVNKSECVVIDESDSDLESSGGLQIEVSAEIHRSCDLFDYGVLTDVLNEREHASRQRRTPRGFTPTSTDSSEKENYNPNRAKKTKYGKKYKK